MVQVHVFFTYWTPVIISRVAFVSLETLYFKALLCSSPYNPTP
jgi:hypothetical protein